MPKISVIVVVHNAVLTIEKCLDSVLTQSFEDFELLIIDDGSTDGTEVVCDRYAQIDKRIMVYHRENLGVSASREFGVQMAKGEYSIHADSDDWMEKGMLEALYSEALSSKADIVICDFYVDGESSVYTKQKPSLVNHISIIRDILLGKMIGSTWNKLIKHHLYHKFDIHFPENINYCEDAYTMINILLNTNSVAYLPEAYYHYVMNPNSITHKLTKEVFYQRERFVYGLKKLLVNKKFHKAIALNCVFVRADAYYSRLFTSRELRQLLPYKRFAVFKSHRKFRVKILLLLASYGFVPLANLLERKYDRPW